MMLALEQGNRFPRFFIYPSYLDKQKKLRRCENAICPKQYVSDGSEPSGFWQRKKYANNKLFWLCDICSLAYNKKQFCDFCKQVYFEENDQLVDGKEWIGCDNSKCKKWNHIECEVQFNNNQALNEALLNKDDTFQYFCLTCTKAKKGSSLKGGKQSAANKSSVRKVNQSEENQSVEEEEGGGSEQP